MKKRNRYTKEMIDFLRNFDGTYSEKAEAFSKEFNLRMTENMMDHLAARYGFRHGPRHTEYQRACAKERLKVNAIARRLPMYSKYSYTSNNGQKYLKVPEDGVYKHTGKLENRFIYEQATGEKLTNKDVILHLDRDVCNNSINNLVKVPQGFATALFRRGYVSENPEITKLGILTEKLLLKIKELEKK